MKNVPSSSTRVAVAFARQPVAASYTVEDVANDAADVAKLAAALRRKLERQQKPNGEVAKIREIASRYGARVVNQNDVEGSVVALRFPAGTHASGFRGLLFVS